MLDVSSKEEEVSKVLSQLVNILSTALLYVKFLYLEPFKMGKYGKRNFWKSNEVKCMLEIFKDLKILQLLEQKVFPVNDIYRVVERELAHRGFGSKNSRQIQNKWSQLKSSYLCAKRNHNPEFYLTRDLEYRDCVGELLESPEIITPATTINSLFYTDAFQEAMLQKEIEDKDKYPENDNRFKQGSYKKTFWKFMQQLRTIEGEIQDEFFQRQKILLTAERKLLAERDRHIMDSLVASTNSILCTTNLLFQKVQQ